MELDELHIAELGSRAKGDGVPVGRGNLGIGRLAVQPPGPARGKDRLLRPDERLAVARVPDQRPAARSFVRQQVDGEGRFPNEDVGPRADEVGHGPHHFLPGRIAQSVHDPPMAVPPFEREGDLAVVRVEMGPVSDQFADAIGRLVDNHVDDRLVAEPLPRRHRVGRVTAEVIQRVENAGDAPLGVGAVGLQQAVLRDDDDVEPRIDGKRRADAGNPAADNQHVGKRVRNPLRIEPHQITPLGRDNHGFV